MNKFKIIKTSLIRQFSNENTPMLIMKKQLSDFKNQQVNSDQSNAQSVSLKSLNFSKDTFGNHDVSLATAYNNHGLILKSKGDIEESIEYFKKAIEIHEYIKTKTGNMSITVISVKQNMALAMKEVNPDQALKVIDEVISVRENLDPQIFSESSFKGQIGICYLTKSQCLRELTKFDEAKEYLEKSKFPILEYFSENSEQWINYLTSKAFLHKNYGELEESCKILEEALQLSEKMFSGWHIISIRCRHNLAVNVKENGDEVRFDQLMKVNTDFMDEQSNRLPGIQPTTSSDADQDLENRLMNLWEFKDKEQVMQSEMQQMHDEVTKIKKR